MSGERVFRDKDGDLWAECGDGQLVDLDHKVLHRIAEKFGQHERAEIEINYGPLAELTPDADT
jgi:hypothetical protein